MYFITMTVLYCCCVAIFSRQTSVSLLYTQIKFIFKNISQKQQKMSGHPVCSETKDNFKSPRIKKPTATRERRFEQFLWQELYDEYIRHNDRLMSPETDKSKSEYYEEFCKDLPAVEEAAKEAAINQYPLYSTAAITLWNHTGDMTKDFRKRYSITRPVHDQPEQFG